MSYNKKILFANGAFMAIAGIALAFYLFIFRIVYELSNGEHILFVLLITALVSLIPCFLLYKIKAKPLSYIMVAGVNLLFVALGFFGVFRTGLIVCGLILPVIIACLNGEKIDKLNIIALATVFLLTTGGATFTTIKYKVVGTEYYVRENGGYTLVESRGENIVIPAKIGNVPVKKIVNRAFTDSVKTIDIASGIEIAKGAMELCENITEITIDLSKHSLAYYFGEFDETQPGSRMSRNITKVNLYGKTMSANALRNAYWIKNVTFLDSIEIIESSAFHSCSGLEDFVLPDTVKEIGSKAFFNCTTAAPFSLHEGLEVIGDNAFGVDSLNFGDYKNALEIKIPSSVWLMGDAVFLGQTEYFSNAEEECTLTISVNFKEGALPTHWIENWCVESYEEADGVSTPKSYVNIKYSLT